MVSERRNLGEWESETNRKKNRSCISCTRESGTSQMRARRRSSRRGPNSTQRGSDEGAHTAEGEDEGKGKGKVEAKGKAEGEDEAEALMESKRSRTICSCSATAWTRPSDSIKEIQEALK